MKALAAPSGRELAASAKPAESAPSLPTLSTVKVDILIVDDSPRNLLALEAMLEPLGQNIVRSESGTQALRELLHRDFALILLDIQMPGLSGFETAQLIRGRERSRHVPIIFLTAFSQNDVEIAHGYELGAVDFLFKPIASLVLRSKVQVFVDLYRKTLELKAGTELLRESERREHEKNLADAARRWEDERLRAEMLKERSVAATLAATVAERRAALQVSNRRLSVLADVANRLLVSEQPYDILDSLYTQIATLLQVECYFNYLVENPTDKFEATSLILAYFSGVDATARDSLMLEAPPIVRAVAASRRRVITEHAQASTAPSLAVARGLGLDACACFPLLAQGRILGTLSFGTRRRASFDPEDISMMQVVCDQVAVALERARLIRELSLRNGELASNDRSKDEFLAMLAHELRNPMAPIVNAVQMLRMADAPPGTSAYALDALERQSGHLVRLVDDLLDISRIKSGKIELRCELVSLASIVRQAIQTSGALLEQRRSVLNCSLPERDVVLHADRTRLVQVFSNLINNAAKYSVLASRIDVEVERDGRDVLIRVRDQGVGIREDMLEKVFGLFIQVERTEERAQGGLGIGLTVVRNLVEMHGGTVNAKNVTNPRGIVFTVRLPTASEFTDEPEPSQAPPPVRATAHATRVILVEDNEDVRETTKYLLECWGYDATVASDGPSGIEAVLSQVPDIALIDIGLPGLDGYEVVTALRLRAPGLTTRLVAVTGYGRPEDRSRALAAGFDDHMVKPVSSEALLRLIESSSVARAQP